MISDGVMATLSFSLPLCRSPREHEHAIKWQRQATAPAGASQLPYFWWLTSKLRAPFLSGGDKRHEHRPDREGVHLRLAGELPQIASGARDRISALEDRCDHDRSGFLAQDGLGLLPGARTDAESRSYDARGGKEVSPVRYPASGIVDDVGTGVEDHA